MPRNSSPAVSMLTVGDEVVAEPPKGEFLASELRSISACTPAAAVKAMRAVSRMGLRSSIYPCFREMFPLYGD